MMSVPRIILSVGGVLIGAFLLFHINGVPVVGVAVPGACLKQAFIDTPNISSASISGTIAGWAFNVGLPVTAVVVRAGEKEVVRHTLFLPRADVRQARSGCEGIGQSGFSISLVVGQVPGNTRQLSVVAVLADGTEFPIGIVQVDFSLPLVEIENAQPITRNGENLFSGWASHADGPVKVRFLAGQQVLWEGVASLPRDDVGRMLAAWPSADKAAFEFSLPAARLPLVDSPTTFEFIAPSGTVLRRPGPALLNQGAIGKVLTDFANAFVSPQYLRITTWAWHQKGVVTARIETEHGVVIAASKKIRPSALLSEFKDPRFPPSVSKLGFNPAGQIFYTVLPGKKIPPGLQRLVVRVRDGAGEDTVFPGPLVWTPPKRIVGTPCAGPRYLAFWPGVDTHTRASGPLEEVQRLTHGGCVALGIQTRIEYLRTTRGQQHDFEFDPDFPEKLRRPSAEREMTSASLNSALAMATLYGTPINLVLDGGVWADSKFSIPEYDVVDWLERDEQTVQWNQWGKSEPDDALKSLAGSHKNPELARMMSLNRYNTRFLNYKKRNFQAAVRRIVEHNRLHPAAVASINLDPDEYINPWFINRQWYDYNPGSLRQFREWLLHTGPYADGAELAAARSTQRHDLISLRKVSGKNWQTIDEIDPPREKPDYSSEWQQLWVRFKRHLVAQHYADLARWASEMGLPPSQIRASQTFLDSRIATRINDVAETWSDEAGVSIEGAKPPLGHLGAIFYGPGSRNEGKPRGGESLLDNVRKIDPEWGIVEMHPGNISTPHVVVSHLDAYRTLLTLINYGATRITPMWGSSAGDQMVHPDNFRSYDVYDQSPFETQFVWWMHTLRDQPWGGQVWPFGNEWVKSQDGWEAQGKAILTLAKPGFVNLGDEASSGSIAMRSPSLRLAGKTWKLRVDGSWPSSTLTAEAILDNDQEISIPLSTDATGLVTPPAGRVIRRIILHWSSVGTAKATISEVRLTPMTVGSR